MTTPSCRIYLALPPAPGPHFARELDAALAAGDVASVLLWPEDGDAASWQTAATGLTGAAHAHGVPLLVAGTDMAGFEMADGLHVETAPDALKSACRRFAPKYMVGAGGVTSMHDAMEAGETGADYVMFGSADPSRPEELRFERILEITAWWAEIFQIPCVAPASSLDQAVALARAGADFVCVRDLVWRHPQNPAAAIAELTAALAKAEVPA